MASEYLSIFAVTEKGEGDDKKSYFTRVGAAFPHRTPRVRCPLIRITTDSGMRCFLARVAKLRRRSWNHGPRDVLVQHPRSVFSAKSGRRWFAVCSLKTLRRSVRRQRPAG